MPIVCAACTVPHQVMEHINTEVYTYGTIHFGGIDGGGSAQDCVFQGNPYAHGSALSEFHTYAGVCTPHIIVQRMPNINYSHEETDYTLYILS